MGSGEADAIKVKIQDVFDSTTANTYYPITGSVTWSPTTSTWGNSSIYPHTYWYSHDRYFYQIECPKSRCHQMNWCELDKTVVCKKCGSVLKAVSGEADYEISVK